MNSYGGEGERQGGKGGRNERSDEGGLGFPGYCELLVGIQILLDAKAMELHNTCPECPLNEVESLLQRVSNIITKLNIKIDKLDLTMPFLPLIVSLITITEKGCAKWTRLLRFRFGATYSIIQREREGKNLAAHCQFSSGTEPIKIQVSSGIIG